MKVAATHRAMVQHVADSLGHRLKVREDYAASDCVDFTVILPGKALYDDTQLLFRYIWGKHWICFLYKYGQCFAQSDGNDGEPTPAQATPLTAYHDLLRCLREQLAEKQALTTLLASADPLEKP